MERLLHYVWKNRLFPAEGLTTTKGESVVVLSPGLHNKNAGPDFYNADLIIGGEDWMGTVEIHTRSSDWYRHGHDKDKAYNNVVLHVVEQADTEVVTEDGRSVPQMIVSVPDFVADNYSRLQAYDDNPPCYKFAADMPALVYKQWMSRLGEERLQRKAAEIESRLTLCDRNWEHVFFVTMARAFGFGINGDAMEQWARAIPYGGAAKHRDNIEQIEALFLGQAGFLDEDSPYAEHVSSATDGADAERLRTEYRFLANKFSLPHPMQQHAWKFMRTRPQNFPIVRIAQLAKLYHEGSIGLSAIIDAVTLDEARLTLSPCEMPQKSADLIIINAMVPMLYAYGTYRGSARLKEKALRWLRELPAETNKYTRVWQKTGCGIYTAADSQAVIQQMTRYCERRDCLRCQIGYQYIKKYAQK